MTIPTEGPTLSMQKIAASRATRCSGKAECVRHALGGDGEIQVIALEVLVKDMCRGWDIDRLPGGAACITDAADFICWLGLIDSL